MTAIWGWLAGRKTYILAGIVILIVLALVFFGRLTPTMAAAIAVFALCGFSITFRSALHNHQAQVIAIFQKIADAGGQIHIRNSVVAREDILAAAEDAFGLAQQVRAESSTASGKGATDCS